jgi:hypothetical protein
MNTMQIQLQLQQIKLQLQLYKLTLIKYKHLSTVLTIANDECGRLLSGLFNYAISSACVIQSQIR